MARYVQCGCDGSCAGLPLCTARLYGGNGQDKEGGEFEGGVVREKIDMERGS